VRLPCAERERFLPADCVTARRNEARCIGAGESRGDYALACFIFRILRRPPHGTGARQGGPIPTRQRRPARWADSHTAAAPGKVGGFPHGSGAGPVGFRRIGVLPNALTRRKKTAWRRPHKAENPLKAGYLLCSL